MGLRTVLLFVRLFLMYNALNRRWWWAIPPCPASASPAHVASVASVASVVDVGRVTRSMQCLEHAAGNGPAVQRHAPAHTWTRYLVVLRPQMCPPAAARATRGTRGRQHCVSRVLCSGETRRLNAAVQPPVDCSRLCRGTPERRREAAATSARKRVVTGRTTGAAEDDASPRHSDAPRDVQGSRHPQLSRQLCSHHRH